MARVCLTCEQIEEIATLREQLAKVCVEMTSRWLNNYQRAHVADGGVTVDVNEAVGGNRQPISRGGPMKRLIEETDDDGFTPLLGEIVTPIEKIVAHLQSVPGDLTQLVSEAFRAMGDDGDLFDVMELICVAALGPRVPCPLCEGENFPGVVCWECGALDGVVVE
jgi:hypothetical protein